MNPKVEKIIGHLDPSKMKCFNCGEFTSKKTISHVTVDSSGDDKPICPLCLDFQTRAEKKDYLIRALDPDMEYCEVCEEWKRIDPEWTDRRDTWIHSEPSIRTWLFSMEITIFCEDCVDEIEENAEALEGKQC